MRAHSNRRSARVVRTGIGIAALLLGAGARGQAQETPALTVGDATLVEGHTGSTSAVFTVTRTGDLACRIAVPYATTSGTATSGSDYAAAAGTLVLPSGAASATVSVPVHGDVLDEADETFTVDLVGAPAVSGPPPALAPHQQFAVGQFLYRLAVADFNGDGRLDIVTVNTHSSSMSVYVNTTTVGSSAVSFALAAGHYFGLNTAPGVVATPDLNGDGRPDLVFTYPSPAPGRTVTFLNTTPPGSGSASFDPPQVFLRENNPGDIGAGDLNADGKIDLVVADSFAFFVNRVTIRINTTATGASTVSFLESDVDPGIAPYIATLADMDADGRPDLVVSEGTNVSVRRNVTAAGDPSASFAAAQILPGRFLAIRDMNADGRLDLVDTRTGGVTVQLNATPPGDTVIAFGAPATIPVGSDPRGAAVADLNLDTIPDVAVVDTYASTRGYVVLGATPAGGATPSFAGAEPFTPGDLPTDVAAGDFDGDGRPDLAVANWGASSLTVSVLLNETEPSATSATIADGSGLGTIEDDDPSPTLAFPVAARTVPEAGGTVVLSGSLDAPSGRVVSVPFTVSGAAAAPGDHDLVSGTLTIPPETPSGTVDVAVVDDVALEGDEDLVVTLGTPTHAVLGAPAVQTITITDDDALLAAGVELSHGTTRHAPIPARPGPVAEKHDYRIVQEPYSSYEVVVEPASPGAAPLALHRLAPSGSLLQAAGPGGDVLRLRWENTGSTPVDGEYIRVAGACGAACGAEDGYRIRVYETTSVVPRYNNAGSQVTILMLQSAVSEPIAGRAHFWTVGGALVATVPFAIAPHASFVLNTAGQPALSGTSGTVTVTSDAPYGTLTGKTVAIDPAGGFSFDSPLLARPR